LQDAFDTFSLFDLDTSYTKLYKACHAPGQRPTKEACIGAWKTIEVEKASIRSLFLEEALDVAERTREYLQKLRRPLKSRMKVQLKGACTFEEKAWKLGVSFSHN
jgi:hypothetical protein